MTPSMLRILVVGATGSIGRLVVEEALRQGHTVRALVRSAERARRLPPNVEIALGDLTRTETLAAAVEGVDGIVFTHGSDGAGKSGAESVDYGGVRNILAALGARKARIALMTAIGVTNRNSSYNRSTESHDWKRRAERLLRTSGLAYTIVRPGWFDYNASDEHKLVFLQGDTRHSSSPSDGVVARRQIAKVLVDSLTSDQTLRKTFELVAEKGAEQSNLDALFAALEADPEGSFDGVRDQPNQPLNKEPQRVLDDLRSMPKFSEDETGE